MKSLGFFRSEIISFHCTPSFPEKEFGVHGESKHWWTEGSEDRELGRRLAVGEVGLRANSKSQSPEKQWQEHRSSCSPACVVTLAQINSYKHFQKGREEKREAWEVEDGRESEGNAAEILGLYQNWILFPRPLRERACHSCGPPHSAFGPPKSTSRGHLHLSATGVPAQGRADLARVKGSGMSDFRDHLHHHPYKMFLTYI